MVYDTEAVIPTEIGLPTLRYDIVDMSDINQNQLLLNLDLVEETRQIAQIKLASYQQQACNFYDQKVSHVHLLLDHVHLLWVIGFFTEFLHRILNCSLTTNVHSR